MNKNKDIWKPFEFVDDRSYFIRIGPLRLWMERHDEEWFLAYDHQADEMGSTIVSKPSKGFIKKPDSISWHRIVATTDTNRITLFPVMDELPIVVGAEPPLIILPRNEALIFINVPVSIRIAAGTKKQVILFELPSVVLSKTWVGSPVNGELCLSLKTSAVRRKEYLTDKPNRVGCPVLIKNQSAKPLELEKLCVHTENLGIYLGENRLWTNKVVITHLGVNKNSEVRRVKGAPGMEENELQVASPRIPAKDGIFRKSFDLFKILVEN
ncbi:MAG: DUF432 domain-containing protein [Spirochaetales bacterium]|nr:DUF432 domain-containing protein [Spirochaetales bacterium]